MFDACEQEEGPLQGTGQAPCGLGSSTTETSGAERGCSLLLSGHMVSPFPLSVSLALTPAPLALSLLLLLS